MAIISFVLLDITALCHASRLLSFLAHLSLMSHVLFSKVRHKRGAPCRDIARYPPAGMFAAFRSLSLFPWELTASFLLQFTPKKCSVLKKIRRHCHKNPHSRLSSWINFRILVHIITFKYPCKLLLGLRETGLTFIFYSNQSTCFGLCSLRAKVATVALHLPYKAFT